MVSLESKIKGALYGFAIGDAMGASTEFMTSDEVKSKYGVVNDIIGGGAFKLKPGKGTDDTAMMLCVCEAIEYGNKVWKEGMKPIEEVILDKCCWNFVEWLHRDGLGCGGCCYKAITSNMMSSSYQIWLANTSEMPDLRQDKKALGNGSLMRALPLALAGFDRSVNCLQGSLTHNNKECNGAIMIYHDIITSLLDNTDTFDVLLNKYLRNKIEPSGFISNTFNNVIYYAATSTSFEESIIGPVNDGGDSDTIAAITGGITGAIFGYENIPKRWIEQLSQDTKIQLDKYAKLFEKINKKVCTNTK